jgi:transcription initiation factor TFIIIB Brf1 subunit/transcription initiation factor TFIIB
LVKKKVVTERCPYCNGILVWDYRTGDVVCSRCGAVIDRIFVMERDIQRDEAVSREARRGLPKTPKSYKMFVKMYDRISKGRKNIYINNTRFADVMNGGKQVRVYDSPRNNASKKTVEEDPLVRDILEKVVRRNPRLASRTERGKVAAALLIKMLLIEKEKASSKLFREVASKSGASVGHIKRIYREVKKTVPPILSGRYKEGR